MKRWHLRSGILVSLTGLAALMQSAYATQPPDSVVSDAQGNTASGSLALLNLTSATGNSAFGGPYVLYWNTSGSSNVAFGAYALQLNTTSDFNTAVGGYALSYSTTGADNVAVGFDSLALNSTGSGNSAVGSYSLVNNSSGENNTAVGVSALPNSLDVSNNTALGVIALSSNRTGKGNEAQGTQALFNNQSGIRNLGIGSNALNENVSGSYNIALGFDAGYNQTTGNDNIYVANQGVAAESQTLRLGSQGTAGVLGSGILSAYVAGVATTTVTGSAVYVTPSGQLGVLASSERFKTDVESMGSASEKLAQLRPVTFKLKTDPDGTTQYGLVAEEVAKIYPELVIHGADGKINGVRYEELAPMVLNVVQQQSARLAAGNRQIEELQQQQADLVAGGSRSGDLQQQLEKVQRLKKQFTELAERYRGDGG